MVLRTFLGFGYDSNHRLEKVPVAIGEKTKYTSQACFVRKAQCNNDREKKAFVRYRTGVSPRVVTGMAIRRGHGVGSARRVEREMIRQCIEGLSR
jgi:hypothetical protein